MGDLSHRSRSSGGTQQSGQQRLRRTTNRGRLICRAGLVLCAGVLIWGGAGALRAQPPASPGGSGSQEIEPIPKNIQEIFSVKIDPKTPISELLPVPPKYQSPLEPVLATELTEVPDLCFQEPFSPQLAFGTGLKNTVNTAAKIKFLDDKRTNCFVDQLAASRPDLEGLPFLKGNDCRLDKDKNRVFKATADIFRLTLADRPFGGPPNPSADTDKKYASLFWNRFRDFEQAWDEGKLTNLPIQSPNGPIGDAVPTRLRFLMNALAAAEEPMRLGLAKYLAATPHAEATRALAKLVLFAPEAQVRKIALEALKVRREKDYTDILLEGLRYPWPEAAARAGAALIELERNDLTAKLVNYLEEPDPRLPRGELNKGEEAFTARQLVRLNHHQNCFLCHPPVIPPKRPPSAVVIAPVPLPSRPLPLAVSEYYSMSQAQVSVRADVTYLRPDFSMLMKVPDAKPWPELQRFDFLVRNVKMTPKEAEAYEAKLKQAMDGSESPYSRAVLSALRGLTGLNAGTTAPQWRKALKL